MEIWKNINGFERYMISNFGNLKSLDRIETCKNGMTRKIKGKIIKPSKSNSGYLCYPLTNDVGIFNKFIHRIVCETFIENIYNKPHINHIDGNKLNNFIENLEWCTQSENLQHSYDFLNRESPNKGKFGKENRNSVSVKQLDLNGNLIKIWDCISDFSRVHNKRTTDIVAALKGRQKTAFGFKWEYV